MISRCKDEFEKTFRRRRHYTVEEKLYIVHEHLDNGVSISELSKQYGYIGKAKCFQEWVRLYKEYGEEVFFEKDRKVHSQKFKRKVVEEYRCGISAEELSIKYGIGVRTAKDWDKEITEHSNRKKEHVTANVSHLKEEQRVRIAKYCILCDFDYKNIARRCDLTADQVRRVTEQYMDEYKVTRKDQIMCIE